MAIARRRFLFARIYVGIFQNVNLPSSIEMQSKLGSWDQAMKFESILFACFKCKKLGHWAKKWPMNSSKVKENPQPKSKKI